MIFVTGATGLLGSHLCYRLLKEGKKVIALKRAGSRTENTREIFGYYGEPQLFSSLIWEEGDILDLFSIEDILNKYAIKEIYHCAALVSYEKKDVDKLYVMNIEGTANMVNAALIHNIEKFCHVSSIAALSSPGKSEVITEKTPWKSSPQHTTYSITKYGAEREVWRGTEEGLKAVIINPSLIIGPGCWNQSSGVLISNAKKGIRFFTDGGAGVVDVRDVVKAAYELMEKNIFNERFILNAQNIHYKKMLSIPLKEFGHAEPRIEISKTFFRVGYRAERLMCIFNGKKPRLAKEFLKSGFEVQEYSSEKIEKALNMKFISPEESFKWACSFYKEEKVVGGHRVENQ